MVAGRLPLILLFFLLVPFSPFSFFFFFFFSAFFFLVISLYFVFYFFCFSGRVVGETARVYPDLHAGVCAAAYAAAGSAAGTVHIAPRGPFARATCGGLHAPTRLLGCHSLQGRRGQRGRRHFQLSFWQFSWDLCYAHLTVGTHWRVYGRASGLHLQHPLHDCGRPAYCRAAGTLLVLGVTRQGPERGLWRHQQQRSAADHLHHLLRHLRQPDGH